MKKILILISSWLSLNTAYCHAASPELSQGAQQLIAKRMSQQAYPSLLVGVLDLNRDANPAWFGFGNLETDSNKTLRLPDQHTLYEIGSITKTFTALLLAQELQQGRLNLNFPVQLLLDFPIGSQEKNSITLQQLATHSSGLPRLPANMQPAQPGNPYADYDKAKLAAYLYTYQKSAATEHPYSYSNLGYGLLGYALANSHKTSYGELLQTRILKPLGMQASSLDANSASNPLKAKPTATNQASAQEWDFDVLAGAGAIRSSGQDMMRYLKQQIAPGNDAMGLAIKLAQQPLRKTGRGDEQIGLGWHISRQNAQTIYGHGGMTGSYASYAAFSPDKKRAVYVVTNTARDVSDIAQLALLNAQHYDDPEHRAALDTKPEDLSAYLGSYALTPQIKFTLTLKNQTLQAQLTGQSAYPVFAESADLFFYKVVDAKLRFIRDADGKVTALELLQNGVTQRANKLAQVAASASTEISLAPELLMQYAGHYELTPQIKIHIRLEAQQLIAQLSGQGPAPIYAKAQDHFFYKVVEAELRFQRDPNGKVNGLTLLQNGQQLPAKKID